MRQSTERTYKATGSVDWVRFLVLFMMGFAVGLFIIAVKMTRPSEALSSAKDAQVKSPIVSGAGKNGRSQAANSKKKAAASGVHSPRVESNDSGGIRTKVPTSQAAQNRSTINVKSDSAPVFQNNSANSALVTTLKKGDEVRVVLEIIDSQGAWTMIRGAGGSGFVRSEMLERKTPEKQAQK